MSNSTAVPIGSTTGQTEFSKRSLVIDEGHWFTVNPGGSCYDALCEASMYLSELEIQIETYVDNEKERTPKIAMLLLLELAKALIDSVLLGKDEEGSHV
ncbi:MAG: DUF3077 domain-containing protein [Oxalobacter formigenes]|nr:DUF3077 domain-containing protein [Oxalobacter formigenes]